MVTSSRPTRAEVNDIINTLRDGASGLIMAAETAIGENPVACVAMIVKLIQEFELQESANRNLRATPSALSSLRVASLLIPPHGGHFVEQRISADRAGDSSKLARIKVPAASLINAHLIANGTYSPLMGFMGHDTLASVLDHQCLLDGTA